MLKMTIDHDQIRVSKDELKNYATQVLMGFNVEITPDDERYSVGESLIVVSIDHYHDAPAPTISSIELGINDDQYDLTNEEIEMIRQQILDTGIFNYKRQSIEDMMREDGLIKGEI